MVNKKSYIVTWTDEDEVYGPDAFADGRIPDFGTASIIIFQNNATTPVTIGIGKEPIDIYEGIMLAPRDGDFPGGHFAFDLKANASAINRIRAKAHGGGAGSLSVMVI